MASHPGFRIRELRSALKLTQTQFGEKIDVKDGTVSLWENKKAAVPYDRILAMNEAFGASPRWLLRGEGDMFSNEGDASHNDRQRALVYLSSLLRSFDAGVRSEIVDFLKTLVDLAEDEDDDAQDENKRIYVPSADEDFDDEEDEEGEYEFDDYSDEYYDDGTPDRDEEEIVLKEDEQIAFEPVPLDAVDKKHRLATDKTIKAAAKELDEEEKRQKDEKSGKSEYDDLFNGKDDLYEADETTEKKDDATEPKSEEKEPIDVASEFPEFDEEEEFDLEDDYNH